MHLCFAHFTTHTIDAEANSRPAASQQAARALSGVRSGRSPPTTRSPPPMRPHRLRDPLRSSPAYSSSSARFERFCRSAGTHGSVAHKGVAPTGSLVDSACSCVFTARDGSTSAYRVARVRQIATSLAQALGLFGSRAARLLAAIPGGRGFSCFLTRLCALAGRARKEALAGRAHFCVRARPLAQPSVQDNVRQPVGQRPMEPRSALVLEVTAR